MEELLFMNEEAIGKVAEQRWSTADTPRLSQLMTAFVRHLHGFAREVELTPDEWMAAIQWLKQAGKISDEKREEIILASDVLGLSMLVVRMAAHQQKEATPATVMGPFYIPDSPTYGFGENMAVGVDGEALYLVGRLTDPQGRPLANATLDMWQADQDGAYEAQIVDHEGPRLRGVYRTNGDGFYCVRTVSPRGYSIPMDGPVGQLIRHTKISHYRPAHVHFRFDHPGYKPLITHIFREGSEYLEDDVVFAVDKRLVVPFVRHEPDKLAPAGAREQAPYCVATYDFVLEPSET